MLQANELNEALSTLGAVMEGRGLSGGILVVGGSSLLLLGLISRPTADVDVMGLAIDDRYVKADRLPDSLAEAARDVAAVMELAPGWLNCGPAPLMDLGLPIGFESRVEVRRYATLEVHIPSRQDLVCFKLYAAVDLGPGSKHFQDLRDGIVPTRAELAAAKVWCKTQDPSAAFSSELDAALTELGMEPDGERGDDTDSN